MLEDGGNKKGTWVLRYKIDEPGQEPLQGIAWPHVIHGEHVLTTRRARRGDRRVSLHAHRLGEARSEPTPPSIGQYNDSHSLRTFAYVHYYETGLCSWSFVPVAFGSGTIGGFCSGSNG